MVCIRSPAVDIPAAIRFGCTSWCLSTGDLITVTAAYNWGLLAPATRSHRRSVFSQAANLSQPKTKLSSVGTLCEASNIDAMVG